MNVPSFEFLGFAAAVAVLINITRAPAWRRMVLLVANLVFFLSFTRDPIRLAPFVALLAVGYLGVKLMEAHKYRPAFVALVVGMVAMFCWLKQYTFIPHSLLLPFIYLTVGMSYVFFRILHLVIDAFQGVLPDDVGTVNYVNYTLNFTSFVSGPIQLYGDYRRTEDAPLPLDEGSVGYGAERIISGFFKVSIVSPLLLAAQVWFTTLVPLPLTFAERIVDGGLSIAIFPVYLYFNFSGYMDFVIGIARLMRLELPENFNRPFVAEGFIDFWSRWHITLSNWLKTYVYTPLLLSLMRKFPSRTVEPYLAVLVYFITFFLVGVWHGSTAMFLVFGVLNGLGVSVNKLYQIAMIKRLGRMTYRKLCTVPAYRAVSRGLTFTWFAFSLLWFWASGPQLEGLAGRLGLPAALLALVFVVFAATVVIAGVTSAGKWLRGVNLGKLSFASPYVRAAWCAALLVVTISVAVVLDLPAPHLVYRAF